MGTMTFILVMINYGYSCMVSCVYTKCYSVIGGCVKHMWPIVYTSNISPAGCVIYQTLSVMG